jgi:hypothetical protein
LHRLEKAEQQLGVEGISSVIMRRAVALDITLVGGQAADNVWLDNLFAVNVCGDQGFGQASISS